MDLEWAKEKVQELISYYQQKTVLWDPKDPHHLNRLKRNDAWEEMANDVGRPVESCKKKMEYLLAALRREKQKMKKSQGTGKGANEVYQSTWFAFKSLKFLLDKNCPRQTLNTMERDTEKNSTTGQDNFTEPQEMPSTSKPPPINNKRKAQNDDLLDKAFGILQASSNAVNDESQSFGNFIAMKLRKLDEDVRTQIQTDIMGLFLKARTGYYSKPALNSHPSNVSQHANLNMDDVKMEPDSDGDSASPPYEPQFVNIKEEHMADDDNTDETSEMVKSDDELSDTSDEDMPEAVMFPIVKIEYHAVDKSQRDAPDEVKEEPWHVSTIKKEKKDEVTTEEHQVCLDSIELFPVKEDHGTTSLVMNVGGSVERECEFTGVTDPLLPETDGGCSSKLLVYSGSEKNNCHKCEINNKEALSHSDDKPFRYEIYDTGFSECSNEVAHTQINSGNKPSKCEVCNNSLPRCKCVGTPTLVDVSDKPFKCGQCNRSFSRRAYLVAHSRTHTGDKPFKCNLCNKRFSHHAYLVTHSRFHTGERPFKCDLCNKSFSSRPCLVTHIRIHTGEKPFICKVCTKSFTSSSHLVTHSRNHTSEKTFKCEVCDKSFKHRSNFVRHSRIHTGETPFNCKECNKSFKQSHHLKVHLRTHSGEKPFKCKECTLSFTCSANLVVHSRIHNDERPFKCEVCNKSFKYRNSFIFHSRIHTGEKPFKCDVCNKSFTHNTNFVRHSRIHTGESRFK